MTKGKQPQPRRRCYNKKSEGATKHIRDGKMAKLREAVLKAKRNVEHEKVSRWATLGWSPKRIYSSLNAVPGGAALPYKTVVYHRARALRKRAGVIAKRVGRPRRDSIDKSILDLHNQQPQLSARYIANQIGVPRETVREHLKDLGASFLLPKNQPHLLTSSEKGTRVAMSIILLAHLKDKKQWTKTITGDESWILFEQIQLGNWYFPKSCALQK